MAGGREVGPKIHTLVIAGGLLTAFGELIDNGWHLNLQSAVKPGPRNTRKNKATYDCLECLKLRLWGKSKIHLSDHYATCGYCSARRLEQDGLDPAKYLVKLYPPGTKPAAVPAVEPVAAIGWQSPRSPAPAEPHQPETAAASADDFDADHEPGDIFQRDDGTFLVLDHDGDFIAVETELQARALSALEIRFADMVRSGVPEPVDAIGAPTQVETPTEPSIASASPQRPTPTPLDDPDWRPILRPGMTWRPGDPVPVHTTEFKRRGDLELVGADAGPPPRPRFTRPTE